MMMIDEDKSRTVCSCGGLTWSRAASHLHANQHHVTQLLRVLFTYLLTHLRPKSIRPVSP